MTPAPTSSRQRRAAKTTDPEARILDAALRMAADAAWYDLSLSDIAAEAGMTLQQVHAVFADTNAVADHWFAAAQDAMLAPLTKKIAKQPAPARLEIVLLRWFDALAAHRHASVGMLRSKFHLPHVHHWSPLAFALSAHVQLWRDAAGIKASGRRRQLEEIGSTAIFLATLAYWCRDTSDDQARTRSFLRRRLAQGDAVAARLFSRRCDAA